MLILEEKQTSITRQGKETRSSDSTIVFAVTETTYASFSLKNPRNSFVVADTPIEISCAGDNIMVLSNEKQYFERISIKPDGQFEVMEGADRNGMREASKLVRPAALKRTFKVHPR